MMFKHDNLHIHDLHRQQSKTDTLSCYAKAPEMFDCQFCDFTTILKVDLSEHFRVFHEQKEVNQGLENILRCYQCEYCDFETHSVVVLTKHMGGCNTVFNNNSNKEIESENDKWYELTTPEGVKWHKCPQCSFTTKVKSTFCQHISTKHRNPENRCEQCAYKCKRKSSLKEHILWMHTNPEDINWHKCELCVFRTKTKSSLRKHIKARHWLLGAFKNANSENFNWFECEHCVYKCKKKSHLKEHIICVHTNPEDINWLKCELCAFNAKTKNSLRKHIKTRHVYPDNVNWFKCDQCAYKSKAKSNLQRHISSKHVICFQCRECSFKTKIESRLHPHIWTKHTKNKLENILKAYRCEYCNFETHSLIVLAKHMVLCNTVFMPGVNENSATKNDNWYEVTSPEGVKWQKCTKCVFITRNISDMKSHFSLEHMNADDIDLFKRMQCTFKSKIKENFRLHIMKNHTNPKHETEKLSMIEIAEWFEFRSSGILKWRACKHCHYTTKHLASMRRHIIAKHLPEKNSNWIKCNQCAFKTKQKGHLNRHIIARHRNSKNLTIVNVNVKWFGCEQCAYKSKRKLDLQGHIIRMHTNLDNISWFTCGQCVFRTKTKLDLQRHIVRKHSNPVKI